MSALKSNRVTFATHAKSQARLSNFPCVSGGMPPEAMRAFKLGSGATVPRVRDGLSMSLPRAGTGRRRIALPTRTFLPSPLEASKPVFVSPSGSDLPAVVLLAIHLPRHEQVVARLNNPRFARAVQDEVRSDCAKPTWRKRSETAIKESKDQLEDPSAKNAKR
jgi:hypothetical protein